MTAPLELPQIITRVALDSEGMRLLGVSHAAGAVHVWNVETGMEIHPPLLHPAVVSAEFSPDGKQILTAGGAAGLMLWDSTTHDRRRSEMHHGGPVVEARFSRDGSRLISRGEHDVLRLWEAKTGAPVPPAINLHERVTGVDVSPDGRRLAIRCGDGTVRIWDTEHRQKPPLRIHPVGGRQPVRFTPDGNRLLTVDQAGMRESGI